MDALTRARSVARRLAVLAWCGVVAACASQVAAPAPGSDEEPDGEPPVGETPAGDTLFHDGFESGALTDAGRWHDVYGNGFTIVSPTSEGIPARGGAKVLRLAPSGGAISHFVATGSSSPYEHLHLSYWLYRKSGYDGIRFGLIRGSRDQWGSYGIGASCPDDPDNANQQEFFVAALMLPSSVDWQLRLYNYWLGQLKGGQDPPVCYGTYALEPGNEPRATYHDLAFAPVDDRWYHYEIELHLNTPGQANGWERVWVDGVLKIEHLGVTYRHDPLTRVWAIAFDVGKPTAGSAYLDDVLVKTQR